MNIVLLSTDLMVVSRVEGAAAASGASVQAASDTIAAATCCKEIGAAALIVDLSAPALDWATLREFATAADRNTRIIAFGPHVHKERLEAAQAAGCDSVLSRGQFFSDLSSLVANLKNNAI